jgi:hypothetical protein
MAHPSDPTLYTDDVFERALFASAQQDRVPEPARERVALTLGIALPGTSGTFASQQSRMPEAASPLAEGVRAVSPGSPAQGKLAMATQAALVGLAGGLVALAFLAQPRVSPGAVVAPAVVTPAVVAPAVVTPAVVAPEVVAVLGSTTSASLPASSGLERVPQVKRLAGNQKPPAQPKAGADAASHLLEELALLDGARAALAASDGRRALEGLERYAARFPRGTLALEAALLQTRALAQTGRHAAAQRLALWILSQPAGARYRAELEAIGRERNHGSTGRTRDIEEAR